MPRKKTKIKESKKISENIGENISKKNKKKFAEKKFDIEIYKFALQNAVKFGGKANTGAVIGKIVSQKPELKDKISEVAKEVNEVVKKVNAMKIEKQTYELKRAAPDMLEEKKHEKKHELPKLKNTEGKVVMRFAPSPSGPLHIGHAFVLSINSEYCRHYNGELILRIEDTNPDNIYSKSYEMIPEDANWVTKNNIKKVIVQSDRLEIYYRYAEQLINMAKAYVCTCDPTYFKTLSEQMTACPCRELSANEHNGKWKAMFDEYKQGQAVLRIKTDLKHKNPAMRDWAAFRINDSEHPRAGNKYRVWPLMNFAVAIDDHELSVTHTVRGKDHVDNEKRQKYIFDYFSWKVPEHQYIGRINFEGMIVSCSETRKLIESGKYTGWDDVRIPFLQALKKRGYQPDAFIRYALDIGITLNDKNVPKDDFFKTLNAFNKEIIDYASDRYFFVENPVKIEIKNAPEKEVRIALYPDDEKRGFREFGTKNVFYIAKKDFDELKEKKIYRLMDCLNFVRKGKSFEFHSEEYEIFKEKGEKIMHWVPEETGNFDVDVLMPDASLISGIGEKNLVKLKEGEVCQLERFGFCRLNEKKGDKLVFWFGHK